MSLWHSIQNLGIRSDTPPFEVRNTRLVIYICLTSVATTAFYGTLFLCLGNGLSAAINFGIATFFLTPLLLLSLTDILSKHPLPLELAALTKLYSELRSI